MGIAANQARLMTLTARQHDLELRAQQISATKMTLSLQSQKWATEYSNALNSATSGQSGNFDQNTINSAKAAYDANTASISSQEKLLDYVNAECIDMNTLMKAISNVRLYQGYNIENIKEEIDRIYDINEPFYYSNKENIVKN